ncbi:MAG: glutamate formimidoyltransferase [Actinomycetota bacterium]|nr:glutamate formimidoyltransferase [Actinomycetota bacterium]
MKLIECVPNFSEGRNRATLDAITAGIVSVPGVELLDVDPGADTNRTVVTFVGGPEAVAEAAFLSIARAADLIDMRTHQGKHPRMGATDVCPFVPVEGVTMEECADLARRLGERVGSELGIPVYLYEHAADGGRRSLAEVRRGEYEGLLDRTDQPDFGPSHNPSTGATAIGAREFLVAYNVNLNTQDRKLAHQVAQAVRELGTPRRDTAGRIVRDDTGKTVFDPGRFKECKAVGWYIDEYRRAQVSINLTDYNVTSVHAVFDACREEAAARGMRVTGSELVGLIPRTALLAAGDHYLRAQGRTVGIPEPERVQAAILSLGLEELGPFDPAEKVVEYRYGGVPDGLRTKSLTSFANELSTDSPAPGGGSVAALCGSLAGSLTAMVAALTHAKKGMEDRRDTMELLGVQAQALKDWFMEAVDRDTTAFNQVLAAIRLPKKTHEDLAVRETAMAAANVAATTVPLEVLEHAAKALELALQAVTDGNPNSVSDAGVAGACATAAARGASLNVRINLPGLAEDQQRRLLARHDTALDQANRLGNEVAAAVEAALAP